MMNWTLLRKNECKKYPISELRLGLHSQDKHGKHFMSTDMPDKKKSKTFWKNKKNDVCQKSI